MRYEVYKNVNGCRYFYAEYAKLSQAYDKAKKLRQAWDVDVLDTRDDVVHSFRKKS